jgi:ketosteroid isomerase-like protein
MAERPEVAVESGAEAVCALADEEFRAMESADVPAFMALLAPDVLFLPPNDRPKEGGGVAPWIREFLKGFGVVFQGRSHEELLRLGEWAVLRTSFRWRVAAPVSTGDASLTRHRAGTR